MITEKESQRSGSDRLTCFTPRSRDDDLHTPLLPTNFLFCLASST
jgi:hypothetical protein